MARLFGALFFAAALMLGWGMGPSDSYACPMKNQAAKQSSPVQLAMEEPEDGSEEVARDDDGGDEKSE